MIQQTSIQSFINRVAILSPLFMILAIIEISFLLSAYSYEFKILATIGVLISGICSYFIWFGGDD